MIVRATIQSALSLSCSSKSIHRGAGSKVFQSYYTTDSSDFSSRLRKITQDAIRSTYHGRLQQAWNRKWTDELFTRSTASRRTNSAFIE